MVCPKLEMAIEKMEPVCGEEVSWEYFEKFCIGSWKDCEKFRGLWREWESRDGDRLDTPLSWWFEWGERMRELEYERMLESGSSSQKVM
jgi:hypothetical protein